MTAVANATFFAAEWNTYVRDNLAATEVGIANGASRLLKIGATANTVEERVIASSVARSSFTTASTTFVDAPDGPRINVSTSFGGMLFLHAMIVKPLHTGRAFMGYRVLDSGGTQILAASALACHIWRPPSSPTEPIPARQGQWLQLPTSITGDVTIEAMYMVTTSGATWTERRMSFIAF